MVYWSGVVVLEETENSLGRDVDCGKSSQIKEKVTIFTWYNKGIEKCNIENGL